MKYNDGQRVIHARCPDWGIGMVYNDDYASDKNNIFFENEGEKIIIINTPHIILVTGKKADSVILDNYLPPSSTIKKLPSYFSISDSSKLFLKTYPNGFNDKNYLKNIRNFIEENHNYAFSKLNKTSLKKLINNNKWNEVCDIAKDIMSYKPKNYIKKNNLDVVDGYLHRYGDIIPFQKGLDAPSNQKLFSSKLYELLYGKYNIEDRFNSYLQMLSDIKCLNWPLVTYFLFIIYPDEFLLVRPTWLIKTSEIFRYDIKYKSEVNFNSYDCMLKFSIYLKGQLKLLKPKDLIDIYSFIWFIHESTSI